MKKRILLACLFVLSIIVSSNIIEAASTLKVRRQGDVVKGYTYQVYNEADKGINDWIAFTAKEWNDSGLSANTQYYQGKYVTDEAVKKGLVTKKSTKVDKVLNKIDNYLKTKEFMTIDIQPIGIPLIPAETITYMYNYGEQYRLSNYWEVKFYKLQAFANKLKTSSEIFTDIQMEAELQIVINKYATLYTDIVAETIEDDYNGFVSELKEINQEYDSNLKKLNFIVTGKSEEDEENKQQGGVVLSPESTCGDDWWGCAFQFLQKGETSGQSTGIPGMLSELQSLVFDIGNIIFIVVTAFLGVKYIWGGVDSKFSVKNSLVTLVVAAIVFYGWNAVTDILNVKELLTEDSALGYQNFATTIYNTIMYIVNVAAIGGIIYIGIKYMMAGADGKAEMKLKLIPVIMGIIMVYGTLNLINFILDIVYTF